jgi:hypothetical protein
MHFRILFEWPGGSAVGGEASFDVRADNLDSTRMQAAMLYATEEFERGPPTAYRILKDGDIEVYRYPESQHL